MIVPQVSSELSEVVDLLERLLAAAPAAAPAPLVASPDAPAETVVPEASRAAPRAAATELPVALEGAPPARYRGERLDWVLKALCQRARLGGAVLADRQGLPLAVFQSPVSEEALAAFTVVMGDCLERAGQLLERPQASTISLDIGYTDKATLRRFHVAGVPYYLIVLAPQEIDERTEVELAVAQIGQILEATEASQ